ncbi:MAG: hypothetical protein GYB66_01805 [Chloroflexi bacterium]|nr:hypothetical protein [Chloroflexota bacterium]
MNKQRLLRIWIVAVLGLFATGLGLITLAPIPEQIGQAQDGGADEDEAESGDPLVVLNENNIKQATVLIMQVSDESGDPVIRCVGSGTVVTADGLILTNAHLVVDNQDCQADRIVIALTVRVDEPPIPTYVAEVTEISRGYDIAILRISNYLDGRQIDPRTLQLPFVELGNSNQVQLDDTLVVFGYPGIANEPVQAQLTVLNGLTSEAQVGERAWLRVTPSIPGLMSGGGAYNRNGELVGIPTVVPARVAGTVVDCRQVYDTDGSGQIDNNDACIPIAGPITALRPSRLARGLVQAAALGIQPGAARTSAESALFEEQAVFSNLFISTAINEAGMPANIVPAAPTGTSNLYLFFDYANMRDGMIYELRTTIDGRPSPIFSLPPVTWNGGQEGLWYIGTSVPQWPAGRYEFTLFIEGRQIDSLQFDVGGGPPGVPAFSDLVFGVENATGELVGANYVIPEGNIIRAKFNYRNMQPGSTWRYQWYLDGAPLGGDAAGTLTWEGTEPQGTYEDLAIRSEDGFVSGRYRLELFIQNSETEAFRLAALSDFTVAGGAGGANDAEAQIFSNFRFAQNERANVPLGIVSEGFSPGVPGLYVFFDWRQISPGTPWTWRWLVDGDVLIEENSRWTAEGSGQNYFLSLQGDPFLLDGTYSLEIEINGIILTEDVSAEVGQGQLPIEAFASAEGIQMVGNVTDAETNTGVSGAMVIVLDPELSVEDFEWRVSQVRAMAQTDREGFFQLPALLQRGTLEEPVLYSILIFADGYYPVSQDGIAVTDRTRSPLALEAILNRD